MLNLGWALLVRSQQDPDQLERLEEWVSLTPEEIVRREQARRMEAALAMGIRVHGAAS